MKMKKNRPNPKANKSILMFSCGVAGLFLGICIYLGHFLAMDSEAVINNPYNARLNRFAEKTVRGKLLSDQGDVLAETIVSDNGTETRSYPYKDLFAHVVGYSTVGKTGLESIANFYLLSSHEPLNEKVMNEMSGKKNTGDNVITTLNTELQKAASEALGKRNGAVIAMEPSTGKILAMVSKPGFDPNTVADQWDSLVQGDSKEARLVNRATQGLYAPGSTFKIITALQYMREHPGSYRDHTYSCSGVFEYDNEKIQCYHKTAHGEENFIQAFANSCNGAFASLGLSMDLNGLKNLSEQLLFNREQPLSLPYNKSSFTMKADAKPWEIMQTAIGQGNTLMTPMHNLMLMSAIANDGVLMKPYLIDHVENDDGKTVKRFKPSAGGELMVPNEANALKELLVQVVESGTGSALKTDAYQAAGKTGSAEFEKGKETHAWFVGFAPLEDPKIAVCVIVEEGGSGGKAAAPIGRKLFDIRITGSEK